MENQKEVLCPKCRVGTLEPFGRKTKASEGEIDVKIELIK